MSQLQQPDQSSLEFLLSQLSERLHYNRAVLLFPDFVSGIVRSKAVVGVPPIEKKYEMEGPTGEGYWKITPSHPVAVAQSISLPFHTCLDAIFLESEKERPCWQQKRKYYEQLDREFSVNVHQRFLEFKNNRILPDNYSEEHFLAEQGMNYDHFRAENWNFTRMYPSFAIWSSLNEKELFIHYYFLQSRDAVAIPFELWLTRKGKKTYKRLQNLDTHFTDLFANKEVYLDAAPFLLYRYGFSRVQYCNTLMLGVYIQEQLIAVAQFDSRVGVKDFTIPLSPEEQAEAQTILQRFVPALVFEDAVDDLQKNPEKAEETLDLIARIAPGDRYTRFVVAHAAEADNAIFFPTPDVTDSSPAFEPIPRHYCLKRYEKAGIAEQEVFVRERVREELGFHTFPSIGATTNYLVSEIEPNIPLSDIVPMLSRCPDASALKRELVRYCLDIVHRLQQLNFDALPFSPTNYEKKMYDVLHAMFSDYADQRLRAIAREVTQDIPNDSRQFDRTLKNILIRVVPFSQLLGVSEERIEPLRHMNAHGWRTAVDRFLYREVQELLHQQRHDLVEILDKTVLNDDYDKVPRGTFLYDDPVQIIDYPGFGFSFAERDALFAEYQETMPQRQRPLLTEERLYRHARTFFHLPRRIRKTGNREKLLEERSGHLETMQYCAAVLGHEELVMLLKTASAMDWERYLIKETI